MVPRTPQEGTLDVCSFNYLIFAELNRIVSDGLNDSDVRFAARGLHLYFLAWEQLPQDRPLTCLCERCLREREKYCDE